MTHHKPSGERRGDKDERIARARELRDQDQLEESQAILLALMDDFPEDPLVLYEVGGSYDVLGEEREAIPYYEDAIEEGLSGDDLQECLICLGSCRRVIGEFDGAVKALETAVSQFPRQQKRPRIPGPGLLQQRPKRGRHAHPVGRAAANHHQRRHLRLRRRF
ncbi:MAG: tetratricopeptide repeat protein [bacterium]|nr:tetratricopeptide repeat protein [bacterium]